MEILKKSACRQQALVLLLLQQIALQKYLKQFISVQPTDQGSGVVVVGDVSWILAEDVAHDLIDGVIPLFLERIVDRGQNHFDFLVLVDVYAEFTGIIHLTHQAHPLETVIHILAHSGQKVKREMKKIWGNENERKGTAA